MQISKYISYFRLQQNSMATTVQITAEIYIFTILYELYIDMHVA